jgi:hypothetical protein
MVASSVGLNAMSQIQIKSIPAVLQSRPQWVVWKYVQREGDPKPTKLPIDAKNGRNASSTDPTTWSPLHVALKRLDSGDVDGIGYVFADDHIGIDLDNCIDDKGNFKDWATEIINTVPGYVEYSPSRKGAHIITGGALPDGWKGIKRNYHDGAVEIYSRARYFTVTGCYLRKDDDRLSDQSHIVKELYQKINAPSKNDTVVSHQQHPPVLASEMDTRREAAFRDPVFKRLWSGDTKGNNNDDSAADLALCNKLAFYFGPDSSVIDSEFRQSGLMRSKWERRDYRELTISRAISKVRDTYQPGRNNAGTGVIHYEIQQEEIGPKGDETDRYAQASLVLDAVSMGSVQTEHIYWVWYPRIPRGKITIVEGDPGIGKSTITLAIASAESRGIGLTGNVSHEPGRIVIAAAEDGIADTIHPRLTALNADLSRIVALGKPFTFDDAGCVLLGDYMTGFKPTLMIIDPLFSYVGNKDTNKQGDERQIMDRISRLAQTHDCDIVCVRHLNKGGNKAIYRGGGSIDFTAAARSVLLVGADPADNRQRAVVQTKNNLAPKADPIGFTLESGKFEWTGKTDLTEYRILATDKEVAGEVNSQRDAVDFLKVALSEGPVLSSELRVEAQKLGISWNTVWKAADKLNLKKKKLRFSNDSWEWAFPDAGPQMEGQ